MVYFKRTGVRVRANSAIKDTRMQVNNKIDKLIS